MQAISMEKRDRTVYVCLRGEITMAQVPVPRETVARVLEMKPFDSVEVDLSGTEFMDSTGVNFLAMLNNRVRDEGGKVIVRNPSTNALRILDLTQLSPLLTIEQDGPDQP